MPDFNCDDGKAEEGHDREEVPEHEEKVGKVRMRVEGG